MAASLPQDEYPGSGIHPFPGLALTRRRRVGRRRGLDGRLDVQVDTSAWPAVVAACVEEEYRHHGHQQRADDEGEPGRRATAVATVFNHMGFANLSHFGPPFFRSEEKTRSSGMLFRTYA